MALPLENFDAVGVKRRLAELIDAMSEEECRYVLQKLEEWTHKNRRKHPRDPCIIPVDYATKEQAFKGFIRNLSCGGVFIQTCGKLDVGEQVIMTFSSCNHSDPMKIAGEVVRRNVTGVGVKFNEVIPDTQKQTWIDCRSKIAQVGEEKRIDPRVEFQCPVEIEGVKGEMIITDISLGGAFVECHFAFRQKFQVDQTVRLLMKLPTEQDVVAAEGRIVSFSNRGMHCKFVNLSPKNEDAVRCCFNVVKHTLPIR